jgi:hypothetical protein
MRMMGSAILDPLLQSSDELTYCPFLHMVEAKTTKASLMLG